MRGVLISVVIAAGLISPRLSGAAVADEAYVCEGGRVAYVRFGQLEAMKRKDPCIAAYYGGAPDAEQEAMVEDSAEDTRSEDDGDSALPVVRTTGSRLPASARSTGVPVLKELPRLATPATSRPAQKVAAVKTGARMSAPPPVAHPETDFRNVRVLNAAPGEPAIFRHSR